MLHVANLNAKCIESRKNGADEPICRAGIEMQTWGMGVWTQQGKERVGQIETVDISTLCHVASVVSNSATPWTIAHQAPLSRDSPGKNTGVVCHALLQGIFLPHLYMLQFIPLAIIVRSLFND